MPSERRLHPVSILFGIGLSELRQFIIPAIAGGATAISVGAKWVIVLIIMSIPLFLRSMIRYLTYRYMFAENEIVIRKGLVFRSERHIPYVRVQNINARQNIFHRFFRVVEVSLETGSGAEAEAVMKVVPLYALEEIREHIFGAAHPASSSETEDRELLHLPVRELLLFGLLERRGIILIAGALAVLSEVGLIDPFLQRFISDEASVRKSVHATWSMFLSYEKGPSSEVLLLVLLGILGFIVLVLLLSTVWSLIRLHDYRLTQRGDALRIRYGLFTRVDESIPLYRIQSLTVREGLLHRFFRRVSVRVTTAGGNGEDQGGVDEYFAPLLRHRHLPGLLERVLPNIEHRDLSWQSVHPRAFHRLLKKWYFLLAIIAIPAGFFLGWWSLVPMGALAVWAVINSRRYAKSLRWSLSEKAMHFSRGWIRRHMTIVPFVKAQTITIRTSPFDRRSGMAKVHVDTAGASVFHAMDIPYLPQGIAYTVYRHVVAEASVTEFKW